jgi:hypothetical protein
VRSILIGLGVLLLSCGPEPKPVTAPVKAQAVKPLDESRRFPKANQVQTEVVVEHLMGKPFLPGGTVARYKKGAAEYEMFLAKLPSPTDAAIALLDWKKTLADPQLIPAFGAYYGKDGGRPVFVFTKGSWIAGIAGLNLKEADPPARILAGQIE